MDPRRRILIVIAAAVVLAAAALAGVSLAHGSGGAGLKTAGSNRARTTPAGTSPAGQGPGGPPLYGQSATTSPGQSATTTSNPTPGGPTTTTAGGPTPAAGPAGGPVPGGFAPVSVTFVSPVEGWVLGTAPCGQPTCTSVARTIDGGRTWAGIRAPTAPLASGNGGTGPAVGQIVFADGLDGWAWGPGLWVTHDGGAIWHQLALPGGASAVTDLVAAGGSVWLVTATAQGSGPAHVLRSPARADAFTQVATFPAGTLPQLAAAGSSVWALGSSSLQVADAARGGFTPLADPCPNGVQAAVIGAFGGGHLVIACGEGGGLGSIVKVVYVSSTGGRTFAPAATAPPEGDLDGVATNGSAIVVGASSGASELYASVDGGANWSTPYSDASGGAPFADIGFTTASQAVAIEGLAGPGAAPFLLMSRDGGRSWGKVPIAA